MQERLRGPNESRAEVVNTLHVSRIYVDLIASLPSLLLFRIVPRIVAVLKENPLNPIFAEPKILRFTILLHRFRLDDHISVRSKVSQFLTMFH